MSTPEDPAAARWALPLGVALLAAAGLLSVAVGARWAPLLRLDRSVASSAATAAPWLRDSARVLTWLGLPGLVEAVAVVAAVLCLRAATAPPGRRPAVFLLVAVFGAELVSTAAKHLAQRARPCQAVPQHCPHSFSFPSGHSVSAAAGYLALALVPWSRLSRSGVAMAAAGLVAVAVAASRVLLGVHFLSDVLAGLVLGWGWALCCAALLLRRPGAE